MKAGEATKIVVRDQILSQQVFTIPKSLTQETVTTNKDWSRRLGFDTCLELPGMCYCGGRKNREHTDWHEWVQTLCSWAEFFELMEEFLLHYFGVEPRQTNKNVSTYSRAVSWNPDSRRSLWEAFQLKIIPDSLCQPVNWHLIFDSNPAPSLGTFAHYVRSSTWYIDWP